jgi:hypothetical protein
MAVILAIDLSEYNQVDPLNHWVPLNQRHREFDTQHSE